MSDSENSSWAYKPGDGDSANDSTASQTKTISWTALEFIEHQRGSSWYFALVALTVLVAAALYFLTRDFFAVGATLAAGIIVGVYAGHKPSEIKYELTVRGINIGPKSYNYNMFKSFSILPEGELSSINFMPIKKLMPPITAYFSPGNEQKIMEFVGERLPYQQSKMDPIDRLLQRLRF